MPRRVGRPPVRFAAVTEPPPRHRGILAGPVGGPERLAAAYPAVEAHPGLPLLHRASGTTGALVALGADHVVLRTASGAERRLKYSPGAVAHEGRAVRLVAPSQPRPAPAADTPDLRGGRVVAARTASGSRAVVGARARTARASRILVEGVHDAELVERVWGDDLRVEGVVVERLDGIDDLDAVVREFAPGRGRRLGVLVDHLVPGSKEARIAESVRDPNVLVLGTPYVDVWQAVRPASVGIAAWPVIPRGTPWKEGVATALGEPDPRALWRRILASVHGWDDLEQPLVLAVESLIDFVTEPGG